MDVLNVYKVYSMEISNTVAQQGAGATQTSIIRAMRAVKKETLLLQETFIERSEDEQVTACRCSRVHVGLLCSRFLLSMLVLALASGAHEQLHPSSSRGRAHRLPEQHP